MAANNITKRITPRLFDWLAALAIAAAAAAGWLQAGGASAAGAAPAPVGSSENIAVRVEIQRHIGYEILPARYLSLPYDMTMNANEQLALLDVGALLLIFVPIVVLLGFRQRQTPEPGGSGYKPALQLAVIGSCLLLLVVSTSNGYISGLNMELVKPERQALEQYLSAASFAKAPAGVVCAFFYNLFLNAYAPLHGLLSQVSGDRDAVTYPLLLLAFGLFFYLADRRFGGRRLEERSLSAFLLAYLFFWLVLSSGIVWYGFLAFPLLAALVFWAMSKREKAADISGKLAFRGFCALVAASVLMGFALRLSNIQLKILASDPIAGKRIFNPAVLRWQAGDWKEKEVVRAYYAELPGALDLINREPNSLIYNVGTRFNFFIRENDKRICKDNQLDLFHQLITAHPYKEQVTAMLKSSGFGYLMVDFNTPTGDNTPEQALANRYKNFLLLLQDNPALQLVATNRVLKETLNGKVQYRYGVFGEVQDPGSYAIYKIR